MRRPRLPWYIWLWPLTSKLLAEREQARRHAERLQRERDHIQSILSDLLAEFGVMRLELERRDRQRLTNRNNRLARSAAGRALVQSTTAAIDAVVYPRRKQRG